jgi:hypothetical protein
MSDLFNACHSKARAVRYWQSHLILHTIISVDPPLFQRFHRNFWPAHRFTYRQSAPPEVLQQETTTPKSVITH